MEDSSTLLDEVVDPSPSALEEDYIDDPDRLYGDTKPPIRLLKKEKPLHRMIITLVARGCTYSEVARIVSSTPAQISIVCRQPWARSRILSEMRSLGRDELFTTLRNESVNNIFTLVQARDESPRWGDRIQAANSLLDRFLGKPVQRTEFGEEKPTPMSMEDIDRELKAVEAETARLLPQKA